MKKQYIEFLFIIEIQINEYLRVALEKIDSVIAEVDFLLKLYVENKRKYIKLLFLVFRMYEAANICHQA